MSKGTPSQGKRHTRLHRVCPRCGKKSLHIQKGDCASCGFPERRMRKYNWSKNASTRTTGTGRMKNLKAVNAKFHSGALKH